MATLEQGVEFVNFPQALRLAREGYAIRRDDWGKAGSGIDLKWIVYRSALFHLIYNQEQQVDGENVLVKTCHVVENDDLGLDDFHALDWTVLPPDCVSDLSSCVCGTSIEYVSPYDQFFDEDDPCVGIDLANPNIGLPFGDCNQETCNCDDEDLGWDPLPGDSADSGQSSGSWPSLPGDPQPNGGGGGGGGGGAGAGGSSRSRKRRTKATGQPTVAISANLDDESCIQRLPEQPCGNLNLKDYSLQTRQIEGTATVGADPQGANDLWFITIQAAGQVMLRTTTIAGQSHDLQPVTHTQVPGASVKISGEIWTSGRSAPVNGSVSWPDHCAAEGPCPDPPGGSGSGE